MTFVENFPAYLADFGVDCIVDGQAARGIFDAAYTASSPLGGVGFAAAGPALTLPTDDVPAAPVGKSMTVDGASWRIVDHQPDGTGVSVLLLERAL